MIQVRTRDYVQGADCGSASGVRLKPILGASGCLARTRRLRRPGLSARLNWQQTAAVKQSYVAVGAVPNAVCDHDYSGSLLWIEKFRAALFCWVTPDRSGDISLPRISMLRSTSIEISGFAKSVATIYPKWIQLRLTIIQISQNITPYWMYLMECFPPAAGWDREIACGLLVNGRQVAKWRAGSGAPCVNVGAAGARSDFQGPARLGPGQCGSSGEGSAHLAPRAARRTNIASDHSRPAGAGAVPRAQPVRRSGLGYAFRSDCRPCGAAAGFHLFAVPCVGSASHHCAALD